MSAVLPQSLIPHQVSTAIPEVVGLRLNVPVVTGEQVNYANFDHAASTPCLAEVQRAVNDVLPWYASVHRGAGFASQVMTQCYEQAREIVRQFVGARSSDAVVFTRNTTDSLNLLARCLPKGTSVVVFDTDHHAALLPWRGPNVHRIHTPRTKAEVVQALDNTLSACPEGPRLVMLTAASNVTGELWPVAELAAIGHHRGARVALDAAQLAPHRRIRMQELGVDYLALSGHKMYAPFGAGALIGRVDWLQAAEPYLIGGGATKSVVDWNDHLGITWAEAPERHEAGSPNVVGAHALAVACSVISEYGWDVITSHERPLLRQLCNGLADIPGLRTLSLFDDNADAIGVVSFTLEGYDAGLIATALSAEYGIGVRHGAFCAHVATHRLLDHTGSANRQALRASIGFGTTAEHVDRLVSALRTLATDGPQWTYRQEPCGWVPDPDPRPLPGFLARPVR